MHAEHPAIPKHPVLYEINTWPWLHTLGERLGRTVTLGDVPENVWDSVAVGPVDAVWLMGVWRRSPAGIEIALTEEPLVDSFRAALSDFTVADVVGSPYSIRDYVVDEHLGGPAGVAAARRALARRGIALILDFVPNHVAVDHRWATEHPDRFVHATADDLAAHPTEFVRVGESVLANGRDPYFPPWRDVLQLNALSDSTRRSAIETLRSIAEQCDGVRCDMAMLMCNEIFATTWAGRTTDTLPAIDYWDEVIPEIRAEHPDFCFIAEAYWGTEQLLRSQGFDYCYDKQFLDVLEHHPQGIAALIAPDFSTTEFSSADPHGTGSVRFIENHDEPRAQEVFGSKHRAAAVTALTQPGVRLIYDGQSAGRRIRLPVQLGREPVETVDADLSDFYRRLLATLRETAFHSGVFAPLQIHGWPEWPAGPGLAAWSWTTPDSRWLIVVNLDDTAGAGLIHTAWPELSGRRARLTDPVALTEFHRSGDDEPTVYVMLAGWATHVLHVDLTDDL